MTRTIPFLLIIVAYGSCMEMRETVERMVMVRTTGSDLQPAATGYLYKKESDGPVSVTHMGESEVMEHLKKFYEQPEAFAAPIPVAAGPFYAKEEDENKAGSESKEEHVIPVVEKSEEENDKEDGIADEEDYSKIHEDYAKQYAKHKQDFDEYLKGVGVHHQYGGGKDHDSDEHHANGDKGYNGFKTIHHYGKGGAGDYNNKKYETYSVSTGTGHKNNYNDADANGKHFAHGQGYKKGDHGHKVAYSKEDATDGFHKGYDNDEDKKDHDFYDVSKHDGDFHKYDKGHEHHGSEAGRHKKGGSHESGAHEADFGKHGHHEKVGGEEHGVAHSAEEGGESSYGKHSDFGSKSGHQDGKSYGFNVKH